MKKYYSKNTGFTFIEVMVTLAIFSLGIVMIFKAFHTSLDKISYLTNRLYATTILDNRISDIERMLRAYKALPIDLNQQESINVGGKFIEFKEAMEINEVEDFPNVFKIDLSLIWEEGNREVSLSRSAYISDFRMQTEE